MSGRKESRVVVVMNPADLLGELRAKVSEKVALGKMAELEEDLAVEKRTRALDSAEIAELLYAASSRAYMIGVVMCLGGMATSANSETRAGMLEDVGEAAGPEYVELVRKAWAKFDACTPGEVIQ